jgi:hypothetical protein
VSIVEIRSTLSHRSLMHRSRRELEQRLAEIAHHPKLTRDDIASAIMRLSQRLPE